MEPTVRPSLEGKIAVVTGGAKGLGASQALALAARGARVVVTDVDIAAGEGLAKSLGNGAIFRRIDVRFEPEWTTLVEEIGRRFDRLDILVNNAGNLLPATIVDQSFDDWKAQFAVHADGTFLGCKHAIPLMAKNGGGSIINMGSLAARQGIPFVAGYSAAKGAIDALTRCVAAYCIAERNRIRCNCIHPGGMRTAMTGHAAVGIDAKGQTAHGALGDPREVGALVAYLASDEASFVNGQAFVIDNGVSILPGAAG